MIHLRNNDSLSISCLRLIGRLPHPRIAIGKICYKKYECKDSKYFYFDRKYEKNNMRSIPS